MTTQYASETYPINHSLQASAFQFLNTGTGERSDLSSMQAGSTASEICAQLEAGNVIYFPKSPFELSESDKSFLLNQKQDGSPNHKNVSYRPLTQELRGVKEASETDKIKLKSILESYKTQTSQLFETLFSPYQNQWRYDYSSFRPIEEKNRQIRFRARNDLLHVDSFTTRFMKGDRILRVFVNLNPTENRIWKTGKPFDELLREFAQHPKIKPYSKTPAFKGNLLSFLGIKSRPAYDRFMLDFHNFLKENQEFQARPANTWHLEPGTAWMVYTDMASHAVLGGQYAIEQTYIINHQAMVTPEKAPINLLASIYN